MSDKLYAAIVAFEKEYLPSGLTETPEWQAVLAASGAVARHTHVAGTTVGLDIDTCATCGLDLRHDIHVRVGEQ